MSAHLAEAQTTPLAAAKDLKTAKALIDECCAKDTEADRRGKAAEELRALASRNATAFTELQRSQIVSRSWRLVAATNTPDDAPALCSVRDERRDAILPPVLEALSEIALLRSPPLLGQQLSTLPTVMAICRHCGRPGAPSERAAPERLSLLAALRWLAAISTHPVTSHLLKQGLALLIVQSLSLRTDQDILLQCCVLAANIASDGADQAGELCRAKVPRLLSRLLVADGRAEVKEHAVAALNRIANAARGEALDGELMSGPVALARLAASDRPDCSSEGAWALHVLSTKGGDKIASKMARTPEVMAILEKRAFERETEDGDVALANKVAQITLEDLTKLLHKGADDKEEHAGRVWENSTRNRQKMDTAAASEESPLVQPRKSRRFVAGALAASLVLAFLTATSARSSGGPRAASFFDYDNDKIFDVSELEYPASQWTGNPCMENCEVVCGERDVSWDTSLDTSHIWESIPAICEHRTENCNNYRDDDPSQTVCDCVLDQWYPGGPTKLACCSLDGNLDGKVTKKCTKPVDCGDHDVCLCACNLSEEEWVKLMASEDSVQD